MDINHQKIKIKKNKVNKNLFLLKFYLCNFSTIKKR